MSHRFTALAVPSIVIGIGAAIAPAAASAATLDVNIELPRISSSDYHRPYVAIWIEGTDVPARTLGVWYDSKGREEGGKNWLVEMRQWWRKTGRNLSLPADGVSSATRPAGAQLISFTSDNPALANLPAGTYQIGVEAAREKGGTEAVKVPFQWPPKAPATATNKGSSELGAVTVNVKP